MKKSAGQLNNKRSAYLGIHKLSKYALVLALAVLLFATTCGLAAGYWIICEQKSTVKDTFVYADNGALSHYVQDGETTYNSAEQFPIVNKSTVDGTETLRDLDFTAYDEDATKYFEAFKYSYSTDGESYTEGMPKDAGSYKIKIESKKTTQSGKSKYGTAIVNYEIKPLALTATLVNQSQSGVYNAAEPTIDGTITVACTDGSTLPSFVNSELEFSASKASGVDAGTYKTTVSVTVNDGYKLDNYNINFIDGTFTITPAPVTLKANDVSYTYGETPSLSYKVTSGTIYSRDTVAVSYKIGGRVDYEKIGKGSYTLTVEAQTHKNYDFTLVNGTATVEARKADIEWTLPSLVYDGTTKALVASYSTVNGDTPNVTVTYSAEPKNVGTYTATATINDDNYTIKSNGTNQFSITARQLTVTVSPITYGEKFDITASGLASGDSVSYTVDGEAYEDKIYDAGEHAFGANAGSNYSVSCPDTITVNKKAVTVTISVTKTEIYDNETLIAAGISFTYDGLVAGDGVQAIITVGGNDYDKTATLNEGTYTISAKLDGDKAKNYDLTVNGEKTLTVIKKIVSNIAVPTVSGSYTYDGAEQTLVLDFNGFKESLFSISGETKATNAGEHHATVALVDDGATWADGSSEAKTIPWTIQKAAVSISPESATLTYGDSFTPNYTATSGTVYGEDDLNVKYALTGSGSAIIGFPTTLNAGTYTLTITSAGNDNYTITYSGSATVTVSKQALTKPTAKGNVSYVYNGKAQTFELDGFDETTMARNDTDCVNAGPYYITIKLNDTSNYAWEDGTTSDISVTFKIAQLTIKFSGIIEVDYNASGFSLTETLLKPYLVASDGTKFADYFSGCASGHPTTVFASATTASDGNGNSVSLGGTAKIGSTYKVTATATSNYAFASGGNTTYLKYKTAKIGSTYYTIEDAINDSSSTAIILAGGSPYVETWFTGTDYYGTKSFTLSNKDLILPYADGVTDSTDDNSASDGGNVYSVLHIPQNVTLNITNGKTLNITALVAHISGGKNVGAVNGSRSVVMNDGNIVADGANIKACGFLKGTGLVELKNSSTATDLFRIYDYAGGSIVYPITKTSCGFPVLAYSMHNISCKTKINYGCAYNGNCRIYVSSLNQWTDTQTITIIGNSGKSLFEITNSGGYVIKYAQKAATWSDGSANAKTLNEITGSNQIKGQKDVIEIHGNVKDNSISITVKLIVSATVSTNTDRSLSIPYMDVRVCNGATLTLSSASYKFMPGSSLTVEDGGALVTGNDTQLVFYTEEQCSTEEKVFNPTYNYYCYDFYGGEYCIDKSSTTKGTYNAKLIINGSGKATINGRLSGNVVSEKFGATLIITNATAQIKLVHSVETYSTSDLLSGAKYVERNSALMPTFGNVLNSATTFTELNFAAGTYYSKAVSGGYAWYSNDINISYNSNGGTEVATVSKTNIGSSGYALTSSDLQSITKKYYDFCGWYFDEQYAKPASVNDRLFASTYLYARWTEKQYTINYVFVNEDGDDPTTVTNPNTTEYFCNQSVVLSDAEAENLTFYAWYYDEARTKQATILTLDNIVKAGIELDEGLTLYGAFIDPSVKVYNVSFVTTFEGTDIGVTLPSRKLKTTSGETTVDFTPDDLAYNNTDTSFMYQFLGWYTDSSFSSVYGGTISGDTTIYAKWITKRELTLKVPSVGDTNAVELPTGEYYSTGQPLTLPDISSYSNLYTLPDGYKFVGFIATSGFSSSSIAIENGGSITTALTVDSNTANALVATADIRKIIKVSLEVNAVLTYTHDFAGLVGDKSETGNFKINTLVVSEKSWFSTNLSAWTKANSGGATLDSSLNSFYILQGDTFSVTINDVKITINRYDTWGNSSSKTFTANDSFTSASNCTYTVSGSVFTFTSNSSGDIAVKWNKNQSVSD